MDLGGDRDEYFQMAFDDDGVDLGNFDEDAATAYLNEIDEMTTTLQTQNTNRRERLPATEFIEGPDLFHDAPQTVEKELPLKRRYNNTKPVEWYMRNEIKDTSPKAKKVCHEVAEMALQKIRRKKNERFSNDENAENESLFEKLRRKCIFETVPIHTAEWTAVTGMGDMGQRYYVTHRHDKETMNWKSNQKNLLGKPFANLLDEAEEINMKRKTLQKLENRDNFDSLPETLDENAMDMEADNNLWVEKYKPRAFIDLLSDNGINRTLLTWLKLWDGCVFGTKSSVLNLNNAPETTDASSKFGQNNKNMKHGKFANFKRKDIDIPLETDKMGRPQHKVALLCGPPGLGKTTLATVVCRHAGYHVIEMNASDDRNVDAFRNSIENATQMKCTLDADPRPNCLIIDEIDGSPAPSINYLVSLIQGDVAKKGKEKKKIILKRPIVCICNDLYTPALRELRKVALVLHFPTTHQKKLSDRLAYVCRLESLACEMKALELLCDKSGQDIRTCLNTLQFASSKQQGRSCIDVQCVSNLGIGNKDNQSTLFDVWHSIFQRQRIRNPNWKRDLLISAFSCGDGEKLRQGCFENYLLVKDEDGRGIEAAAAGMKWFAFSDTVSKLIARTQVYSFMAYQSYIPIIFHNLFATSGYTRIQFPQSLNEMKQKRAKNESIVDSLVQSADPRMRQFVDKQSLSYDIAPNIMQILVPNIRLVNTELYGPREKAELSRVVDCMIYFGLQYRQQMAMEGKYQFVLEPSLEDLAYFGDVSKRTGLLAQTAKLLISRELNLEKIRRSDKGDAMDTEVAKQRVSEEQDNKMVVDDKEKSEVHKPAAVETAKKLTKLNSPNKVQQVFGTKQVVTVITKKHSTDVWFKYNEGYSNAIRRNIRMKDLL